MLADHVTRRRGEKEGKAKRLEQLLSIIDHIHPQTSLILRDKKNLRVYIFRIEQNYVIGTISSRRNLLEVATKTCTKLLYNLLTIIRPNKNNPHYHLYIKSLRVCT